MPEKLRDEKLRWAILNAARWIGASKKDRWVSGSLLADAAKDDDGRRVDNDDHAINLIGDLCGWGFLEEQHSPHGVGSPSELRHRFFRFTDKGFKLWSSDMPAHPGIWSAE